MRHATDKNWKSWMRLFFKRLRAWAGIRVYFGRSVRQVRGHALVFFPHHPAMFCCGLAGIVSFVHRQDAPAAPDCDALFGMLQRLDDCSYDRCLEQKWAFADRYLGGAAHVDNFLAAVRALKRDVVFCGIFADPAVAGKLSGLAADLAIRIRREAGRLDENMGRLGTADVEALATRIDTLRDIHWCLETELIDNLGKVRRLLQNSPDPGNTDALRLMKKINAVFNSIDRLEVRGRDSAGMSLMLIVGDDAFQSFERFLEKQDLADQFARRKAQPVLVNGGIELHQNVSAGGRRLFALSLTYKVAAEIGKLGDNVAFLREQVRNDLILQYLATLPRTACTLSTHTRWASVGAISEPNCHPLDNRSATGVDASGIIHACLNGDIDNYLDLKRDYEKSGGCIHKEISTDTKIIPIQIEKYLCQGADVEEAFRRAVNDFEGSHAISMHTDLAPGKLFLAQKGSGQAIFVGLAPDHYMPTSEVYGFVEETSRFVKMDGEGAVEGPGGRVQGQIFILDQNSAGGIEGLRAMSYDGTPIEISAQDVKTTEITSRDIDRQGYPHYFLKEISESPLSVERTLRNRWRVDPAQKDMLTVTLDAHVVPQDLGDALREGRIRRIFFIGQGTAGVAAQACADILNFYLNDPGLTVSALKSSELSGFGIVQDEHPDRLNDMLVIAISQSGTTTDTNRAVDMVRERGAHTLAIVNRRDSDITFKVDGVMYTSSGRDVEMSVASTKAFYAQIVAGALIGLYLAAQKGSRDPAFISKEVKQLLALPGCMRKILEMKDAIGESARRHAVDKTYWATVGSGPNKASADEIRIKLSELCYKTISSDFVEDKKHIDLSSEPLIIVCAAGANPTVIADIVKDTAIFQAHKATPIVIADSGETRFNPYAADVFHVPAVAAHLAPVVNTLVGHIWGYYAALAINAGSEFLDAFRQDLRSAIDNYRRQGLDIYEVVLEKSFREKIAAFYQEFRRRRSRRQLPVVMGFQTASDLTLLAKYLSGRLPVTDFELDFGQKGTALNMIETLFGCLSMAINSMARPVDAIKHQAKTVTVGTSRIPAGVQGILFETLAAHQLQVSQLTNSNVIVLRNLQAIVEQILGAILYRIANLSILGEPTADTVIQVVRKQGVLAAIPSRVESDPVLKGTKRIIVAEGNVYIGKGRKDDRSIIIIPALSDSAGAPNRIAYLLLLNIAFRRHVPLADKIRALGGKYARIKDIVQENSVPWNDHYLDQVPIDELFGRSAEKIGEMIVGARR